MSSLFDEEPKPAAPRASDPLAERMRPRTFDEFVGQEELLARGHTAARSHRTRPAAVDHPLGSAGHR
jgi:replication-associated recombination protein RarA